AGDHVEELLERERLIVDIVLGVLGVLSTGALVDDFGDTLQQDVAAGWYEHALVVEVRRGCVGSVEMRSVPDAYESACWLHVGSLFGDRGHLTRCDVVWISEAVELGETDPV